jgi:hypothetical protein
MLILIGGLSFLVTAAGFVVRQAASGTEKPRRPSGRRGFVILKGPTGLRQVQLFDLFDTSTLSTSS